MEFHQETLENGLTIVAERNPNVFSVAMAFVVTVGARDESPELMGVSHFLEHMAFKGTEELHAEDVNRIFDEIGAEPNASTGDESTQFYVVCLPEHLEVAFPVLSGILFPTLRQADFDMEKKVILEEIGMYQDLPSWVAYEHVMSSHFGSHPLGNRVLGTPESVGALTRDMMADYHKTHYVAENITLVVTGHFDWDELLILANRYCGMWPQGTSSRKLEEPVIRPATEILIREESFQEHLFQISRAPTGDDPARYAAELLCLILGDSSGSRFFWELVDPGLAESADIGYNEFEGYGIYMSYMNCQPQQTRDNLDRMLAIYQEVEREGVTPAELERAKNKTSSRIVLRGERPMGRLRSVSGNWIPRKEYRSIEDDLKLVESITQDHISELLKRYPLDPVTTTCIGPLKSLD